MQFLVLVIASVSLRSNIFCYLFMFNVIVVEVVCMMMGRIALFLLAGSIPFCLTELVPISVVVISLEVARTCALFVLYRVRVEFGKLWPVQSLADL